jgi:beta-RFAP synthase
MIRVRTGSRLHFGLLSVPSADRGQPALPVRRFGGAGMMVESPGVCLAVRPAADWSAEGPLAERALAFARWFAGTLPPGAVPPHHLVVERCPPEHMGLGTGTQLGLAVARALAAAAGWLEPDAVDLARRVGRGLRSAIGVHGFARGGFLVDAGQRHPDSVAPLLARVAVPEAWRVLLVLPPWPPGRSGHDEHQAFTDLARRGIPSEHTDRLCRLVLLGMLPSLIEADLGAFGEAVYEFNARVGECFAAVQGGVYADPRIAELVGFLRRQGMSGAGQSSWGPAVFGIAPDPDRAADMAGRIREQFGWGSERILLARAWNDGAKPTGCS